MSTIGLDFTHPLTGTTSYYSSLETQGKYLAMMKFGYCFSDYE